MPEIAEVARAVHYLHKHLVGKTLKKVTALEDNNVFGKVGTSHTELMKHLTGKKVIDAGQQGKYFWMIMSSPPHPVMHFGMSGWFKFKSEHTYYYKKPDGEAQEWPPKFWKLMFETDGEGEDKTEAAYVDSRRFGRVRLVDCPGKDIRKHSPLVENGPDPVLDKDIVTVEWLKELCQRKKVPIKAMLLDQANISGIGNWVGDEIMYNAKMHPEQYANTLSDAEITKLHKSIHYICGTAVDLLADSDQFPETWLFKHRWGKGKKDSTKTLPTGEKIIFLEVGGRTSAVVPSIQKKSGPVAKDVSDVEKDEKPKQEKKGKAQKSQQSDDDGKAVRYQKSGGLKRVKEEDDDSEDGKPASKKRVAKKNAVLENGEHQQEEKQHKGQLKKSTTRTKDSKTKDVGATDIKTEKSENEAAPKKQAKSSKPVTKIEKEPEQGRRRSGRLRN